MKEIKGEVPPPLPDEQPPTNKEEALKNIIGVTDKLNTNQKAGRRINEVNRLMSESKNAFEKTFGESITKLFDKKDGNLKMVSRLTSELTYYIVKHLLVLNWYATYWNKLAVNFSIVKTKKYPYWEVKREYIGDSLLLEKYNNAYNDTIDDLLMLTISQGGLGRTELLQAVSAAEDKMREGQLFGGRVAQTLQKFGLG